MRKYRYADFLKSESKWREFLSQRKNNTVLNNDAELVNLEESLVTLEPFSEPEVDELNVSHDNNVISFSDFNTPQNSNVAGLEESTHGELVSFMDLNDADRDMTEIDAQTTNFADIRAELESQLRELDNLRSSQSASDEISFDDNLSNVISFNDIEPESYGMGGRRAA